MTIWEVVRMACYTIGAPAALFVALWLWRQRMRVAAVGVASLSVLFLWYMAEITLASTGIDTREYRVIGTPMIVIIALALVVIVAQIRAGKIW